MIDLGGGVLLRRRRPRDPRLVPQGFLPGGGQGAIPEDIRRDLRWLAQKDLLGQDVFLLGPPSPLRRWLALAYCELSGREVEVMALSRDTTESDLKQVRKWGMGAGKAAVCTESGGIQSVGLIYIDRPLINALFGFINAKKNQKSAGRSGTGPSCTSIRRPSALRWRAGSYSWRGWRRCVQSPFNRCRRFDESSLIAPMPSSIPKQGGAQRPAPAQQPAGEPGDALGGRALSVGGQKCVVLP